MFRARQPPPGLGFYGLARVQGLGFRVQGSGSRRHEGMHATAVLFPAEVPLATWRRWT